MPRGGDVTRRVLFGIRRIPGALADGRMRKNRRWWGIFPGTRRLTRARDDR